MYKNKKVSIIIPTYNEEKSIAGVINGFFTTGLVDEVIAVDNNARGATTEEIKKTKAIHVKEYKKQGYGYAIMRGLREATGDILIISEADNTFDPKDVEKFLAYSNDFEVILVPGLPGRQSGRALLCPFQ